MIYRKVLFFSHPKESASLDTLLQLMESYGYIALFVAMVLENANIPIPVKSCWALPDFSFLSKSSLFGRPSSSPVWPASSARS